MGYKLKLNDKIILFFCLAIIAICWFLIFNLDYIRSSENDSVKIGSVSVKGQDVRKKIGSNYFWSNIQGTTGVHRGDSIFAGEKSSALIEFDNGDSLTLKENSLVKFENKKNALSIDISFGQMQVVSKTKFITVKDCGKDVLIEAENANFGIDKGRDCGDVQIKVKSGQVKLANKLITAKSDTPSVNLQRSKKGLSIERLVKSLERPQNVKAHIQSSQNNTLEFIANWNIVEKATEYELEISTDPKLKKDIKKIMTATNNLKLPDVKAETLYYRVRANESSENTGVFSPIGIASAKYRPTNIQGHIQLSKNNELDFISNWDSVDKTKDYELEISTDPKMQTDVQKHIATTNNLILPNVKAETLYYRVRANESADKMGVFSSVEVANVKESLIAPEIKTAAFQVEGQNSLSLNLGWQSIEKASKYRVEISETSDFKKIKTQTLADLKTKFNDLNQTFAYVRAQAENKYTKSEFSTPKLVYFKYDAINPNNKVVTKKCMVRSLDDNGKSNDFQVEWQPIPMADEYVVKVLNAQSSNQVSELRARKPASLVTVPTCGEYNVKVEAYDKNGRKISSEFDANKILYQTTVALTKPIIAEAEKGMDIFFQKGIGRYLWLKWTGVVKPDNFYKVQIASDIDFKSDLRQFDVKDNKLLLKSKFPNGEYFWRVREYRADLFSDWSDVAKIRIISNKPEQ